MVQKRPSYCAEGGGSTFRGTDIWFGESDFLLTPSDGFFRFFEIRVFKHLFLENVLLRHFLDNFRHFTVEDF